MQKKARLDNHIAGDTDNNSLAELYHENSKQRRYDRAFGRQIIAINSNPYLHRMIAQAAKTYAGAPVVPLPRVSLGDSLSFEETVTGRRSIRDFTGESLSIEELSTILYLGNGITGHLPPSSHGIMQPVRAAPSGGALYPIELYAIVSAVDELTKGIYLYSVPRHALQLISEGDFASELAKATSFPEVFSSVSVTFVLTALFGRTTFKYGERGYRFALLEAGHIAQNILLAATAQKLGAVAVGGFIDDEINDLLDIDGVEEAAVYLVAAGRPRRQSYGQPDNLGQSVVDELISMLWTPKSTSNDDNNGVDGSVNQ